MHVWRTALLLPERDRPAALALLSPDEEARAGAFLREADRWRFVAARAWLRRVLASYLGRAPERLTFAYGVHGKPMLPEAEGRIDFNLSHSGGHAALAVSAGFPVGIDLEEVRPVEPGLAEQVFSPTELGNWHRLPEGERGCAFHRGWTRKEAYLKALGSGLAVPLDGVSVSLSAREPARLLHVRDLPDEAASWQVVDLAPGPGLVGAVAARRLGWTVLAKA